MLHTQPGVADRFLDDIRQCTSLILANPEDHKGGSAAIYGVAQSMPDRGIVDLMTRCYLDAYYSTNPAKPVENGRH